MKKHRYSLAKTSLWVAMINIVMAAFGLIVLYAIKIPQPGLNMKQFSLPRFLLEDTFSIIYQCIFYYFSLNGYYRLMVRKARWQPWLGLTLALVLACFIIYILSDMLVKRTYYNIPVYLSLKIFSFSVSAIIQIGIALLIAAVTKQLDEKKWQAQNQIVLEQRASRLEKEKMQADYLFLKAQINPHFLHNTLNFLYARSLPYSAELSEGILTLSEIMRYSLDKEEDADGKVLLTREIEHMNNIIKIQQLRFDNALQFDLTILGDPTGLRILPFILITLVENAFKHGDLKNADAPVRLLLEISQDGKIHFLCVNKKKTGPKELSTGIGLENTRRRLELAYGENYSLYIKDQRDLFTADLTITL